MKIIIIALFISYAFGAASMTLTADSTGCKLDVSVTSTAATEEIYYAIAICTTAPTGTANVAALKTAGCTW